MNKPNQTSDKHAEDAVVKRFVRGGSWAFIGKLTTYPLGLVLTMLFARLLSTAEVGAYFLVMSMAMLGSGLLQAGLATTMCKVIARSLASDNHAGVRRTIRIGVMALLIGGSAAFLLLTNQPGIKLMSFVDDGDVLSDALFWIAAMIVVLAAVNYCCEILRGFSRLPSAALFDQQLLQRLLLLIALLVVYLRGLQLELVTVLQLSTYAGLVAALLGGLLIARIVATLGHHGENVSTGEVVREAPAFFLIRINTWLLNSAAVWVLGFARPLEETAMYGAGNVVALIVIAAWQVVSAAIGPTIVTLSAAKNTAAIESVMRPAATVAALPGIVVTLILIGFGEQVLELLFTADYTAALTVLLILATGRTVSTLFGSPMMLLSMTQHQDTVLKVLMTASLVTLAAFVAVAGPYGAVGVALVGSVSVVVQSALFAVLARRQVGINTLPQVSLSNWRAFLVLLRD